MDGGHFLELLAAHRTQRQQLLRPGELLVICLEHGAHGEVLHLRVRELRAEDHREWLAATNGRAQLDGHLAHDSTYQGVHLGVAIRIRGHGGGNAHHRGGSVGSHLGHFDSRTRHRIESQGDLDRLITLRGGRGRRGHSGARRVAGWGRGPIASHRRVALAPHHTRRNADGEKHDSAHCPYDVPPPRFRPSLAPRCLVIHVVLALAHRVTSPTARWISTPASYTCLSTSV